MEEVYLTDEVTIGNKKGKDWADETLHNLKSMPNVIVKNRSQVFGYYDHNMMVMLERTKDHISKNQSNLHQDKDFGILELKKL